MELQHTRVQRRLREHIEAADKANNAAKNPAMKQVIFWIIMILAFVCVISAGMILVNFSMNTRL